MYLRRSADEAHHLPFYDRPLHRHWPTVKLSVVAKHPYHYRRRCLFIRTPLHEVVNRGRGIHPLIAAGACRQSTDKRKIEEG